MKKKKPKLPSGYRYVRAGEWLHNGDQAQSFLIPNWWIPIKQIHVGSVCEDPFTFIRRKSSDKVKRIS